MGQVSAIKGFAKIETPFFEQQPILKMSKNKLQEQAALFISSFSGETSFAVKSNSEKSVIQALVHKGIKTFDVASLHEMALVKAVLPSAILHYHNPVRSSEEVAMALNLYGCKRFSIDHISALEQLNQHVQTPAEIEVAIRFRMETTSKAVQSFKSKFGVLRDEAIMLARTAHNMGFKVGLTFHPGSQTTSPAPYLEHIKEAVTINTMMIKEIEFLNIGGGFPSSYKGLKHCGLSIFFEEIAKAYRESFDAEKTKLECEPGRALVAGAGTLVTKVKNARQDRLELFLNDGIYGGLMEFHQFPDLFPHYEVVASGKSKLREWTVYGPTCDPIDVLPRKLFLPESMQEGDTIEFHGVGAYSTATATRFNGYGAIDVQMV